jgi:MFS family permease
VTTVSQLLMSRPFVQAMLTNFLFFMSMNGFLLLPIHVQYMGGDEAQVGLVQATYSVAGILFQPLVGVWVNRLGRRFFMRLGVVLLVLSAAGFVFSTSVTLHATLRGVQGLAFSAFFVSSYIHIVDLVPVDRRGWALGIFGLSGLTSTALAPLLGEAVVRHLGFRWSFALSALIGAAALVLVYRTRGIRPPAPGGGPGMETLHEGLQELLRLHMALGFFFGLGTGTLFTFLPTFAEALGVTGLGLFYTAYSASAVAVRLFGGDLIDTRGRRAVIVPSMVAFAAAVCMLALLAGTVRPGVRIPVLPFVFLAGLISGGAHGFLYPALSALLVDVTAEPRRASAVGIFSAATLVGNAVGAVVFGYVAYRVGYAPMWTALAALMGGGIVLSMRLAGGPGPVRAPDTPPRALPPHEPTHRSVDLFPSPADTAEALRSTASAEDAHEHGVAKRKAGTPTRS